VKSDSYPYREISFVTILMKGEKLFRQFAADKALILTILITSVSVGFLVAVGSPIEYEARTRILPYKNPAGNTGNIAGLAGLAGIRLPQGSTGQTIPTEIYPEVTGSQDFLIPLAETKLHFRGYGVNYSFLEFTGNIRKPSATQIVLKYTVGIPTTTLNFVKSLVKDSPLRDSVDIKSDEIIGYEKEFTDKVEELSSRIKVTIDKKTSVIMITGKMPDPYAAADLVKKTTEQLISRITEYESKRGEDQLQFVTQQYRAAKEKYESAQEELAKHSDENRSISTAKSQITQVRLLRQANLASEIYEQLARELEQAQIKLSQVKPEFATLEKVTIPNKRISPNRTNIMLLSSAIGLIIGLVASRIKTSYRSFTFASMANATQKESIHDK